MSASSKIAPPAIRAVEASRLFNRRGLLPCQIFAVAACNLVRTVNLGRFYIGMLASREMIWSLSVLQVDGHAPWRIRVRCCAAGIQHGFYGRRQAGRA